MTELKVNILQEDLFILLEDIEVEVLGYKIRVKAGFDFDGASIPRILWSVYGNPLSGKFRIAALVHDVLYASQVLSKEVCDKIFLSLMEVHGVGYLKRASMYQAVSKFGITAWKSNQDELSKYAAFVEVYKK